MVRSLLTEENRAVQKKMASFYTNEGDNHMLPNEYLLNQKISSFHHFGTSGEMGFIPATSVEQIERQLDFTHDSNHHGLSLSLGSQEPSSSLHFHSGSNQYNDNSTLFSLLDSVSQIPQNNSLKHVQHYKYLEVARDLLDELVSVQRVSMRIRSSNSICTEDVSRELTVLEHHQLQDKMSKLMSMLDEVDRRYKQYRHQMQELASSFDAVAGPGASPQYTSLAFRTISCQFRSLSDAIKKKIISAQKGLGVDSNVNSHEAGVGVLSRLRCVDQQLRQQRFGVMRQAWRPQRGLPENAVSVLRAWLFEHFLHPYPKDSEKVVLAREAGLTRSQVANWFINARVRLWKPMIEEMYKEEFGFDETKVKPLPDHMMTAQETSTVNQSEFQETFIDEMKYGNG